MNKISLLLSFLLLIVHESFSQLQWLNPKPSGYINTKVSFVNKDTGFIINYNGDLIRTNDAGNNWYIQRNFPGAQVLDLKDSTGIIPASDGTVYITTDNGDTWTASTTGLTDLAWADIVSRDTIFLIRGSTVNVNKLYRSSDRGKTWQLVNNDLKLQIVGVDFLNSKIGYGSRWDGLYRTTDGGVTWNDLPHFNSSTLITSLKFLNDTVGYISTENTTIYRRTNIDTIWAEFGSMAFRIHDFFIVNDSVAYAGGESGSIYRTSDSGKTWSWASPETTAYQYNIESLFFLNDTVGFATGFRGRILKTTDGGKNWTAYSPHYADIKSLSFGSATTGYASNGNKVYKTTNAGQNWLPLSTSSGLPDNGSIDKAIFFSADTGIITSKAPLTAHRTTDGGQTWSNASIGPGVYEYITSISFPNKKTGYVVARNSSARYLFRTVDGGVSWNEVSTNENVNRVFFVNDSMGYGTSYPNVYRTIDSGKTWSLVLNGSNDFGNENIHFINPAKGFFYNEHAYLKMTADSGKTWTWLTAPDLYEDILAIDFFNDSVGYLTSANGKIYKTRDGGTTWWKSDTKPYNLRHISFGSDSTVYFGGDFGSILGGPIADYNIDSLKAMPGSGCDINFSAIVRAVFSKVDSVWVEYGTSAFENRILAFPSTVENGEIRSTASLPLKTSGATYRIRVRIYYKSNYYYSAPVQFLSQSIPKPIISAVGNILTSSVATGNQWYLNGVAINGATGQQYVAVTAGTYTVQATVNGCITPLSQPYSYVVTAINDPVLNRLIVISPNPFNSQFTIRNQTLHRLEYKLFDIQGRTIMNFLTEQKEMIIRTTFSSGIYFLEIKDTRTGKATIYKLVRS